MEYSTWGERHSISCGRPAIANTIISFQQGWPQQPAATAELVVQLVSDMEALVAAAEAPDVSSLRRLLGFSSCIAAISRACASALQGIFPGAAWMPGVTFCW